MGIIIAIVILKKCTVGKKVKKDIGLNQIIKCLIKSIIQMGERNMT